MNFCSGGTLYDAEGLKFQSITNLLTVRTSLMFPNNHDRLVYDKEGANGSIKEIGGNIMYTCHIKFL